MAKVFDQIAKAAHVVRVGPGFLEDFETGAILQAVLTYPRPEQYYDRSLQFLKLCAAFAAEQERSVPDFAAQLRERKPQYFAVNVTMQRAAQRTLKTALRYRMFAGLMARPFVGLAKFGDEYELEPALAKLNPTQIANWVAAHHNLRSGENLLHRAWRPSLPVLPLVIGLDTVFYQPPPVDQPSIWDARIEPLSEALDMQDIDMWRRVVGFGQDAFEIVRQESKIRVKDADILRLIWCE